MSQANQVAVAGPSSLSLADPSRTAGARNGQQQIPRFLLKLYEILNDPANEELIKWSEAGDSFYIYNQERFAREVLGKWFKHQNFSSFVRQLNLYGFRKISALQQGLLRTDHDSETIQFAHPYFHRGQPDLLALIQRKRHPPNHTHVEEAAGLLHGTPDGKLSAPAVDVHAIVEGINSIRRQQQIIAADLHALKQSNDALWKEAIEARQRHAKHEDTINRILKFLAGLFGRVVEGRSRDQPHGEGETAPRRQMLMIGDGRPSHGETASDFGGSDFDRHTDAGSRPASPFTTASERFDTIETPAASVVSPVHSPPATEIAPVLQGPRSTASDWPAPSTSGLGLYTAPPASTSTIMPSAPAPTPGAPNPEAMWQATFQQMLQQPEQFQRIAQAFSQTQQPPRAGFQPGPERPFPPDYASALQLPPYNAGADLPSAIPQQVTYPPSTFPVLPTQPSQPHPQPPSSYPLPVARAPAPPTLGEQALLDNNARMQKAYHDTAEINADVDMLQSNIHSLIRDMGLDPNNPALGANASIDPGELPFDTWLEQLSNGTAPSGPGAGALPNLAYPGSPGRGGDDLSAYLDMSNVDSTSGNAGPVQFAGPKVGATSPAGQKRKLEEAEIPKAPSEAEAPASKKKR